MSNPPTRLTPFGNALAGAFGACIANALVYPLDTVKTKIQASSTTSTPEIAERSLENTRINIDNVDVRRRTQAGIRDVIIKTWREQGLGGFYRGFGASMMNTFSMQFAYFYWYTIVRTTYLLRLSKSASSSKAASISTAMELLLGAVAGALAQIFTIPVSVVATRQQLDTGKEGKGLWETVREIVRDDGVAGLWSGLRASLVLTVNPAITYGMFEKLRSLVVEAGEKIGPQKAFLIGAGSKSLATVVTYPYIMAKVRQQAASAASSHTFSILPTSNGDFQISKPKSPGAVSLLLHIARQDGLKGWYRGMQAQLLKATLTQALLFGIKDFLEGYTLILMIAMWKLRGRVAAGEWRKFVKW